MRAAFHRSEEGKSEDVTTYSVEYTCREGSDDWRACAVDAYGTEPGLFGSTAIENARTGRPKRALAFIVDGMGGHLAWTADGRNTFFMHSGVGGYTRRPQRRPSKERSA